ncbi:MAG: hypothetical protein ACLFN8_03120 [Candidatus Woesearchaeota archaeon]
MIKTKKGAITLYFVIIAMLVAIVIIMLYTAPSDEEVEFVGATQQKLLISKEIKDQAITFLDMSMNFATQKTIQDLNENSGFGVLQHSTEFPCAQTIYPVINEGKNITCFPNHTDSTKIHFKLNYDRMIRQNPELIFIPRDFDIIVNKNKNDLVIDVKTIDAVSIPVYQSFSNYYDDKIQNLIGLGIPRYSYQGQKLESIKNIPNIICDEQDTKFGKICAGNPEMVQALRRLSEGYLVPQNKKMIITQAYRDYAIQKALYDYACANRGCMYACNPDTRDNCPHMIAGAIDMNIMDDQGNLLNNAAASDESKQEIINIMCSYGFVNWIREHWHFEYGTTWWEVAQERKARGDIACQYPFT